MEETKKDKDIDYTVGDQEEETELKDMTPTQILEKAGIDPNTNYLIQIEGKKRVSYKDDPNTELKMHNGMKFIFMSTGPTPVS